MDVRLRYGGYSSEFRIPPAKQMTIESKKDAFVEAVNSLVDQMKRAGAYGIENKKEVPLARRPLPGEVPDNPLLEKIDKKFEADQVKVARAKLSKLASQLT